MSDDKKNRGPQDRAKVDGKDPSEVGYIARKLETSPAKIHQAIAEVGSGRKAITKFVQDGQAKAKK